jgi:hypothetical protein
MSARSLGLLTVLLALAAVRAPIAQRQSAAEGSWSGQAQCVVVAKSADYSDEQTHTWRLAGEAPTPAPRGSAQVYYTWPATWSVQGSGRKAFPSREPVAIGREQSERWTIASEMKMSLRITDLGTGRLRIGSEGQRGAPLGSIRVTEVSGRTRDGSIQPWTFPAIEDSMRSTTISGTSTRTFPEGFGVGWGQPSQAITTATCTWSFSRVGVGESSRNAPLEVAPIAGGRGGAATIAGGLVVPAMPAPRTITLAGFTAAGNSTFVPPRTVTLGGFTAAGNATFVPPRTIVLTGWSSVGIHANVPGGPNE